MLIVDEMKSCMLCLCIHAYASYLISLRRPVQIYRNEIKCLENAELFLFHFPIIVFDILSKKKHMYITFSYFIIIKSLWNFECILTFSINDLN